MSTSILSIPVPVSGFGASVDVSAMVGSKTIILTGTFKGVYIVYGAHVGGSLAPLFQFDAGGVEGIRRTYDGALAWVAIRSLATGASGVTASISGDSVPGNTTFATIGTLAPGAVGPQPSYDLGTTNYQSELNFILVGGLEGKLVVEGSSDAVRWNPVGQFSVDPQGPSLLTSVSPEFAPLATADLVRYVRLNVLGRVKSTVVVTVGGSKSGGGGGFFETLSQTYQAGSDTVDQTVLLQDARGGKVVFSAVSPAFTDDESVRFLTAVGVGAAMLRAGGMVLGPVNIVVGLPGNVPVVTGSSSVVIGPGVTGGGDNSVMLGTSAKGDGDESVVVGHSAQALGARGVAIGFQALSDAMVGPPHTGSIAVGSGSVSQGFGSVVIGLGAKGYGLQDDVVVGDASVVYGSNCTVIGASNHVGIQAQPMSVNTICGYNNTLWGDYSVVVGTGIVVGLDENNMSSTVVAIGRQVQVGGAGSSPYAVAIGYSVQVDPLASSAIVLGNTSRVTGSDGLAVGRGVLAGANEAVFGSATSGYSVFRAVSTLATSPDLCRFFDAVANNGETGFYLLRKATTSGLVELKQVTLGAPSGGKSNLQVDNA